MRQLGDIEKIADTENMTVEETLRIALEAHEGQKDLDGKPAVLHPVAVGLMGCNDAETKTGFLHDVVEDSDLTLDELRGRGVDEDVLAALQLLTHAKTEDYFDYVRRIAASGNITAIHVKISDLRHNLERGLPVGGCPYSTSVKQKLSTSTSPISVSLSEGMTGSAMNDKVMKGA